MAAENTTSPEPPSQDAPVLKEAVRRLADVYSPERIYLFGSVARGDAGLDRDYDIIVVVRDDAPQDLMRSRPGYRATRDLGYARDIVVFKSADFQKQLQLRASFPSTVVREGKVLYGV